MIQIKKDFSYAQLNDRYAVVVGASDTWVNYRHQADALAFYQLLKSNGYDDDHIILIMEDNIAFSPLNIRTGEVRVTPDGDNLYHDVAVDYHLSDISVVGSREHHERKEIRAPQGGDSAHGQ